MTDNVKSISPADSSGLRQNISEMLEFARSGKLSACIIAWLPNDRNENMRTYWNGDHFVCQGLAAQAVIDISRTLVEEESHDYEPFNRE